MVCTMGNNQRSGITVGGVQKASVKPMVVLVSEVWIE